MTLIKPDRQLAAGQIFHAGGPMVGGWWVYHVWESHPEYDRLLQEKLERTMLDAGFPTPQTTSVFQVQDLLP